MTFSENLKLIIFALTKQRSNTAEAWGLNNSELDQNPPLGTEYLFGTESALLDALRLDEAFDEGVFEAMYHKLEKQDLSMPLSPRQLLNCTLDLNDLPLILPYREALKTLCKEGMLSADQYETLLRKDYIRSNPAFHDRLKAETEKYQKVKGLYGL